jgi:CheY-like chemotaxis protein
MDARTLGHIFDPFFTTKSDGRGTGLGLSIVQSIAREAGGFIAVTSTPGEGTTFRVHFPTRAPRTRSQVPAARASQPGASAARVLVVDDLAAIRELVSGALRRDGYDVISVGDTRAAAEVLGSTPIDLLITDLHLPDGDGSVLARSARRARPELRAILMSGSMEEGESFDGVLQKPFAEDDLLRVVREALMAG